MTNPQPEITKKQAVLDYLSVNPDASTKEVVKAMKKQRIDVSDSSVYNIKWAMKQENKGAPSKSAGAKAESQPSSPPDTAAPQLTKTQAVKNYLAAHPTALPKEVSTALKAEGTDVTATYVSGIKFHMKKRRRKAPAPEAAAKKPAADDRISLTALLEARKLAEKLGGIEKAKRAIVALSQLTE